MSKSTISVELPVELKDYLAEVAERKFTNLSTVVRQILAHHVESSKCSESLADPERDLVKMP